MLLLLLSQPGRDPTNGLCLTHTPLKRNFSNKKYSCWWSLLRTFFVLYTRDETKIFFSSRSLSGGLGRPGHVRLLRLCRRPRIQVPSQPGHRRGRGARQAQAQGPGEDFILYYLQCQTMVAKSAPSRYTMRHAKNFRITSQAGRQEIHKL